MPEYIERETLWRAFEYEPFYDNADRDEIVLPKIDSFPAADVAPVRHGKWTTTSVEVFPGPSQFLCYSHKHEECGFQYVDMNENGYDYCPGCGAIMDGGTP